MTRLGIVAPFLLSSVASAQELERTRTRWSWIMPELKVSAQTTGKAEFSLRASLAFRLGDNADLLVSPVAGVQTVDGVAKLFALDGASDTPADASVPWRAGGALSYLVYSDRQVSGPDPIFRTGC